MGDDIAGSSSQIPDMQRLIECPICYSVYDRPLQLSCGHTLCANCLQRLVDQARNARNNPAFDAMNPLAAHLHMPFIDDEFNNGWLNEDRIGGIVRRRDVQAVVGLADAQPVNPPPQAHQARYIGQQQPPPPGMPGPMRGHNYMNRFPPMVMPPMMMMRQQNRQNNQNNGNNNYGIEIKCPECRKPTVVPPEGLPVNYRLQDMVTRVNQQVKTEPHRSRCKVCQESLTMGIYFDCLDCGEDGLQLCPICSVRTHNGHNVVEKRAITEADIVEMKDKITACTARAFNALDRMQPRLEDSTNSCAKLVVNYLRDATTTFTEMASAFDDSRDMTKKDIDEKVDSAEKMAEIYEETLERVNAFCRNIRHLCDDFMIPIRSKMLKLGLPVKVEPEDEVLIVNDHDYEGQDEPQQREQPMDVEQPPNENANNDVVDDAVVNERPDDVERLQEMLVVEPAAGDGGIAERNRVLQNDLRRRWRRLENNNLNLRNLVRPQYRGYGEAVQQMAQVLHQRYAAAQQPQPQQLQQVQVQVPQYVQQHVQPQHVQPQPPPQMNNNQNRQPHWPPPQFAQRFLAAGPMGPAMPPPNGYAQYPPQPPPIPQPPMPPQQQPQQPQQVLPNAAQNRPANAPQNGNNPNMFVFPPFRNPNNELVMEVRMGIQPQQQAIQQQAPQQQANPVGREMALRAEDVPAAADANNDVDVEEDAGQANGQFVEENAGANNGHVVPRANVPAAPEIHAMYQQNVAPQINNMILPFAPLPNRAAMPRNNPNPFLTGHGNVAPAIGGPPNAMGNLIPVLPPNVAPNRVPHQIPLDPEREEPELVDAPVVDAQPDEPIGAAVDVPEAVVDEEEEDDNDVDAQEEEAEHVPAAADVGVQVRASSSGFRNAERKLNSVHSQVVEIRRNAERNVVQMSLREEYDEESSRKKRRLRCENRVCRRYERPAPTNPGNSPSSSPEAPKRLRITRNSSMRINDNEPSTSASTSEAAVDAPGPSNFQMSLRRRRSASPSESTAITRRLRSAIARESNETTPKKEVNE